MPRGKLVTLLEFSRMIGISSRKVYAAANKGKFTFKMSNGAKVVDPKKAEKEWKANKSETALKKNPSGKKKVKGAKVVIVKKEKEKKEEGPPTYEGLTTADAERKEKVFKAKISELRYLEQAGSLVEIDKVEKKAFELARRTRDAVMSIPAKMSHELAVETNPHKLEIMLTKALQKTLQKLIGKK